MQAECIRRRRGHIRRRLQLKNTEEEKKAHARRHEAIFTRRDEDALAAKQKQRLERRKEKDEGWQDDLCQLDNIFSSSKKLTKKQEKTVNNLLTQNFPDKTPPPSDSSSAGLLDSQLTSNTSDDGFYSNQRVSAVSLRYMARLAKRERKMAQFREKRKKKIAAR
jgi:hypothetical protein